MVYPIIYRVSTIQGGAGFLPSTVVLLRLSYMRSGIRNMPGQNLVKLVQIYGETIEFIVEFWAYCRLEVQMETSMTNTSFETNW
jgi:hypothetical protein